MSRASPHSGIRYDHLTWESQIIRDYMRTMGSASGAPIEPPEQTRLLDACLLNAGVVAGGVPGGNVPKVNLPGET